LKESTTVLKTSFSDRMRIWFKWFLDPVGAFLNRLGLTPNAVTLLGLAGTIAGALMIARGQLVWGGILIALMGPVDALDGTMARLRGEASDWGAFVDSVTDRYTELFVWGALLYYFTGQENLLACMLVFAAAGGSVLVSYVKARADSLQFEAKIGLLTRLERYLIIAPALILNHPLVAVWLVAIFANITALQRIYFVRRQARRRVAHHA
jgi:CDP-diacylglycerol---glycerol-3-phosphate 3-phosphatidyltransferase